MKLAFVDVETTGGQPAEDRIIDIGIVLVDDFEIVEEWQSLVNPEGPISPFITGITGISDMHVSNAPTFKTIHESVQNLLEDRIFVAHNVRFDYSFVKSEFFRLDKKFQASQLCTVKLSHKLYPEYKRHNLDEIISRFNISIDQRHRALPDAKTLYYFINRCIEEKTLKAVTHEMENLIHRPAFPLHVPQEQILKLPQSVGVYIFFDASGSPLYIGKSKNIHERVLSHFYDDLHSNQEMLIKNQIAHIDSINCAGELEALVLESRLIKELKPICNKKLRTCQEYSVATLKPNQGGYLTVSIEKKSNLSYEDKDTVVAISKRKQHVNQHLKDLVDQYQLCPKLCALETGKGTCFSYHLGTCNGACIAKEAVNDYNLRVKQAFSNNPIPRWPFDEPIVIHEHNDTLDIDAYHTINKWCFISTARTPDDILTIPETTSTPICLDELKIIRNYLFKPTAHIIPLSRLER